jgi:hypothetical protein
MILPQETVGKGPIGKPSCGWGNTDPGDCVVLVVGLKPLYCWDHKFEFC